MNRIRIVLVLFIALFAGCVGYPVYQPARVVYATPAISNQVPPYPQVPNPGATAEQPAPQAPVVAPLPASCPYGAQLGIWSNQWVCLSLAPQPVYYTYNGFGWGVATGIMGALIIQRGFRGYHGYRHR